jgi:Tfp pilus assembly protein PilX
MTRPRGFILIFVIMVLILVGIAAFVRTAGANTMLFHADGAQLRAVERNLIASGLAWASEKVSAGGDLPVGQTVDLDVAAFGCPSARLAVQIEAVQDGKATVRIESSCRKGRRSFEASRSFAIPVVAARPR